MQLRWTEEAADDLTRIADYPLLHTPDRCPVVGVSTSMVNAWPTTNFAQIRTQDQRAWPDAKGIPNLFFARDRVVGRWIITGPAAYVRRHTPL